MTRGDGSLGSWSRKTSHSSSQRRINDDKSPEEEVLEVNFGEERSGHRPLEKIQCSSRNLGCHDSPVHRSQESSHFKSRNCGSRGRRSSMTTHSSYCNYVGYVDRGGSRSQETSHSSSCSQGTIIDIQGRGGYRSPTRHY